jgi:competence protein ComEA
MKNLWLYLLAVVFGLLGAGVLWLASSPPRGTAIQLMPAPTPAPLQVYVSGAVKQPGVYKLPVDHRVQDAIQAAGGFTNQAVMEAINLAAPLDDGMEIWVPSISELEPPQEVPARSGGTFIDPGALTNINTATQEELESLPGIGPVIAQEIIAFRQTEGYFKSIEEIQKVPGVGPGIFTDIQALIEVGDLP